MGTDSKKRRTINVLLIVFTILTLTGSGLLTQAFVRQSSEVKNNVRKAEKLEIEIADMEKEMAGMKEKKESLTAEIDKLEIEKEAQEQENVISEETIGGMEGLSDLKNEIQNYLGERNGTWSVYVKDLSTGEYLAYNSQKLKAASLIKLYIMSAVYDQIAKGNLEMTDYIYTLLNDMITVSDNESANELVRQLSSTRDNFDEGMMVVNEFASANGYVDTSQGRDLRDQRDKPAPGENYTSVMDCGRFLENVYTGTNVSENASAEMLNFLKNQTRRNKIPSGLPEGVVCANKTGELSDTENDAAIVFEDGGPDYIICVMSQDLPDTAGGQAAIKELSGMIYNYFMETTE